MNVIASTRIRQVFLGAALGLAVAGMAGCGSGSDATSSEASKSSPSPAKQKSGVSAPNAAEKPGSSAPKAVGKPSRVIVTIKGAPKGTGKVTEAEFEQGMKQVANFRGLKEIPPPGSEEYVAMRNEVMGDLISTIWALGQAERWNLEISDEELANALQKEEDTLLEAEFTQATMEERVKYALIVAGLEARLRKIAKREHKNPFPMFHREDVEIETKWPPRTHCVKGFVVQQCGNYHASGGSE